MIPLPASIESSLGEAGFSGTEIIILKKLMEEDALTLRELAAKTGKSTGVLDQAMKKLLKKEVVEKKMINETGRYALKSLESVLTWMEEDFKSRHAMMVRRHQNFETFVKTLTTNQEKRRPEVEHFEGVDGVKKAYMQLLNRGNELVQFGPSLYLAEEDPLRDFRVQWFRERQRRGIFSRVITHDTVLGRRFQSRDPFEYRKTVLVDPESYPARFETIVAGDTIACFHLEDDRAVFVRYPEMATEEKLFFDRIWNKKIRTAPQPEESEMSPENEKVVDVPAVIDVPFKTKALSQLREFFLSKRSIAVLAGFAVLSAAATYGLYLRDVSLNTKRIQERALSIAATGALQFDPADVQELRTLKDIEKPEYARVVYQLNLIRSLNPGVRYAYIMRQTDNPDLLEFVADADALDPYQRSDLNNDGQIDGADELPAPGRSYDISGIKGMQDLFRFEVPTTDPAAETDQWGEFLSGYGPIKNSNGETIALFGVDIEVETVQSLSRNMTVLLIVFISLFFVLVLIRMFAFNRSLLRELRNFFFGFLLCDLFKRPDRKSQLKLLEYLLLAAIVIYWVVFAIITAQQNLIQRETGKRLLAIASLSATKITARELEDINFAKDMKTANYQKIFDTMNLTRRLNPEIQYVYILRPTDIEGMWEFIADADANYFIPFDSWDYTGDGLIDEADENVAPGVYYDARYNLPKIYKYGLTQPVFENSLVMTQWGRCLSASAPIYNENGMVIAVLVVDAINEF